MRFAFISFIPTPWGGSEELWSKTALRLRQAGHSVLIAVRPWAAQTEQIKNLKTLGCIIHYVQPPSFVARTFSRHFHINHNKLGKLLRHYEPDLVVHSVCWHTLDIDIGLLCESNTLPYVRLIQNAGETSWPLDHEIDIMDQCYRSAAACCFVSKANCRLVESQLGMPLDNVHYVRNPFSVPFDRPLPWPAVDHARAACVGRLEPASKGQDLVIRTLSRPAWDERPLHVTMFGSGNCETSIRRLARTSGLSNRVTFAGYNPDVAAIWAEHHLLFLPSRMEAGPIVTVEAMLTGRVPVVTAVGFNPELIEDGKTGFLAESATESAVSDALDRAWACRDRWLEIGHAAASTARRLVPEDSGATYADYLLELIQKL